MPTWFGTNNTNFLDPGNWNTGILPNLVNGAVIDSALGNQPTLAQADAISIITLDVTAGTLTVAGSLTVDGNAGTNTAASLTGTGTVTIASTGVLNVGLSGLNMTGGTLNNFGNLGSTLQVSGGIVDNRGAITGAVTVSGGVLSLNAGSSISDSVTLTVNTGGTVNVNASENVGQLAGTGGEINIGATHVLTVGDVGNSSFAGLIAGNGSLTKDGSGTLTLTGNNSYAGTTTISEGTLRVGGTTGSLGTGAVVNNGELLLERANDFEFANAISGTGSLTIDGSFLGTVTLSNVNTYTGSTEVGGGVLRVTGSIASNSINVSNTGSLVVESGAISDTAVVQLFSGNLTLIGNERIGVLASTSTFATVTLGTHTLTVSSDGDANLTEATVFAGVISGSGGLTKVSSDILILTGNNDYTGTTRITNSTLQVGNGGTTGSLGSGAVVNNGALVFDRSGDNIVANNISGTGTLRVTAGDALFLTGANSYSGTTTIDAGATLNIGRQGTTGTLGTGGVINNGSLEFLRSDAISVANLISGSGQIQLAHNGTVTLTAANTYTGSTVVSLGSLIVAGSIASQRIEVFNESVLQVHGASLSDTATLSLFDEGHLVLTGSERIGALAGEPGGRVSLGTHTLTTSNEGNEVFAGVISGAGGLTVAANVTGSGLVLTGANTYTGTTTIETDGYLQIGNGGATGTLGAGAVVMNGVLQFFRTGDFTVANVISGGGILSKSGAGNLTLSGNSTTTGFLSIEGGSVTVTGAIASQSVNLSSTASLRVESGALSDSATVSLGGASNLTLLGNERIGALASSSATSTVTLGAFTLTTGDAGNDTFAGVIGGTGGLTKLGTGTFTLTGDNTYSGTTTISAGTLQIGANSGTGSLGTGAVVNNGALVFDRSNLFDVANAISGTGALTVTADDFVRLTGTADDFVRLTGTNSYSGTTTINAGGSLVLGNFGASSTTGTLGTGAVTNNGTLTFARSDNALTVANAISGSGEVFQGSSGTTTLSGVNTYTGQTVVLNGGVLNVTGSLASQSINVQNGSLRVDGAAISDTATVMLGITSNLTLTGSETIGRLTLAGSGAETVNLGGNHLTLAAQTVGLAGVTFNGSAGADRLTVTLASTLANFTLAGVNFATWTDGTDIITVNGNALANSLTGNALANVLSDGVGAGVDTLTGGAGNDTYIIRNAASIITEGAGQGTSDRVSATVNFALAADDHIEVMTTTSSAGTTAINLTGNGFAQAITGNAGVNVLSDGGGAGGDTLTGLGGDDTYILRNAGSVIVEGTGQGAADRVAAGVSFTLAADDHIEALTTTSAAGATAINLTGNALAQAITGNAGINVLSDGGGAGIDTLTGLGGNDTYIVRNAGTVIVEGAGQGTNDRVAAGVSFTLAADDNIEVFTTNSSTGTAAINLTGNALGQSLTGNAGANVLDGKGGNDTLKGGAGADDFVFSTVLGAGNVDEITDFAVGVDDILLLSSVFSAIGVSLSASEFRIGAAVDANDFILYNAATGALTYDSNGNAAGGATQFATLQTGLALTVGDFGII